MKIKIKQLAIWCLLMGAGIMSACEKDKSDADFGLTNVYMPQAVLSNLNYFVPSGNDVSNYNYTVDNSKVNIRLGVTRSGSAELENFTVNVSANTDTIATMLANRTLDPTTTVVMPASLYSLPQTVTVADGKADAAFILALDKAMVKSYTGKKLALGVVISNPTKYTLNTKFNKVVVIVDVNALKLP